MTSLDVDVLSVRKIYAKGNNQVLPANTVLTTDGLGGTYWTSLSSISGGTSYNTIVTSSSTFTSSAGLTQFSILDGSNIGLLPTNGAAVSLYSKSFGQINVPGQAAINSFNTTTGQFNNTFNLIGTGILTISTNTTTNQVFLNTPNDAISSLSSLVKNMTSVNTTMSNAITSFNSPFSTFIYSAISSFSTSLGPTVQVPQLAVAFSSFSTALGPSITSLTFASTLSTNTTSAFFTKNLITSTLTISGSRQPFIQYGSRTLSNSTVNITLNTNYVNSEYIIQLTYLRGVNIFITPLSFSGVTTSNFVVHGDTNATFHWTTYGNLF